MHVAAAAESMILRVVRWLLGLQTWLIARLVKSLPNPGQVIKLLLSPWLYGGDHSKSVRIQPPSATFSIPKNCMTRTCRQLSVKDRCIVTGTKIRYKNMHIPVFRAPRSLLWIRMFAYIFMSTVQPLMQLTINFIVEINVQKKAHDLHGLLSITGGRGVLITRHLTSSNPIIFSIVNQ